MRTGILPSKYSFTLLPRSLVANNYIATRRMVLSWGRPVVSKAKDYKIVVTNWGALDHASNHA